MYCKKCGKKLNEDDRFCSSCGEKVTAETVKEDVSYGLSEEKEVSEHQGKKPFVIEKFNWDLEGFPTDSSGKGDSSRNEEVEFNWVPVMEQKRQQEAVTAEAEAEKEAQPDEFLETFEEKATSGEPVEFDWSMGTTTRFERTDMNVPDKADEVVELTMDDIKVEDRGDTENTEETEAEKKAKADKASVDKFYTFNKKNAEFQALLDQEYDRLRQRLREEAEAEEMLSERYKRMEAARESWETEGDSDNESQQPASVSGETGDEKAKGLQEEQVVETEVTPEDNPQEPAEAGQATAEEPQDTEEEQNATPSTGEAEVEASLEEEEQVEASTEETTEEPEKADSEEAEAPEDPEEEAEVIRDASLMAGAAVADAGIGAAESATAAIVAEEVSEIMAEAKKKKKAEKKAKHKVTVKNVPEIKEDEAGVEVAQPLQPLTLDLVGPVAYQCSVDKAPKKEATESGKSGGINYCNIFDDEAETVKAEKPKKSRKGLKIFLDIIIVLLIVVIVCAGIMLFARDSVVGQKLDDGYKKVVALIKGKPAEKKAEAEKTQDNPLKAVVDKAIGVNKNVKAVSYDPTLVLDLNATYPVEGLDASSPFIDSVWYTGDDGNAVNYGDRIMGTVIRYYSALADKENGSGEEVLTYIKPDTGLYKEVQNIKGVADKGYEVQDLKIGEVRNNGNYYYVLVETTVLADKNAKAETSKSIITLQAAEKNVLITGIYTIK